MIKYRELQKEITKSISWLCGRMLNRISVGYCQLLVREGRVFLPNEKTEFETSHHSLVRSWAYNTSKENINICSIFL